ncbi:MAG: enoyl-CoA hydratase/isomerase family protein [Actinomycetota bacterium]
MPDFETLLWEQQGHVATLTLSRPEVRNAISWKMFGELEEAFGHAASDAEVRCLVVTGAGGAFCSGADLTDPQNVASTSFELKDRMAVVNAVARGVASCPTPTIAKVGGIAAGAGCNLALLCDLVVASREAAFAELFVKRGLVVDFGGTWALSRLLPLSRAKELALLGETLSADDAHEWGLVNRLCEPDELDAVTKDLAERVASRPPRTVALIKETLNRAADRSLEENLEAEGFAQSLAITSEDTREAVAAWIEKREPRFKGR